MMSIVIKRTDKSRLTYSSFKRHLKKTHYIVLPIHCFFYALTLLAFLQLVSTSWLYHLEELVKHCHVCVDYAEIIGYR